MIDIIRDHMLYNRYIVFEDNGQKVFLIDTQQDSKDFGGLYLWGMDGLAISRYDTENYRLKITGVDEV
jgi:hypothetical protein